MARRRSWTRRFIRSLGASVAVLAAVNLVAAPVAADVGGELTDFFDDMGSAANVTGPTAYQGQSAGYYTGGGVWTRFPQRAVNPVNLQLPSVNAGCGGIDIFSGSFSFINSDEMVAMLKSVANNALGFAFQLAIKSISPQISQTIEEFAQKAQQLNQFNMNSCEMAQGLVAGLWGKNQGHQSEVCKAIANSQGWATDWAKARQGCNAGGERASIMDSNADPDMPADSYNYTWYMLEKSYPSFSREFKEYLMSLVGTIIYERPAATGDAPTYRYYGVGDRALLTALIDGSSATTILRCDEVAQCLNPSTQTLNIDASEALKSRVLGFIQSMEAKVRSNAALTNEEIGLLGATSIPLYKIITVNAAAQLGGMSTQEMHGLAEIVAMDLLDTIANQFYSYVAQGVASFDRADPETLGQWRDQMHSVREVLRTYSYTMNERLVRTQAIVERTVFLESTLRNSLSPQLSAALSFSTAMSAQGIQ
ncbi:MAG: conjugal transfer protein TraH [Pseudomonadota bacterium]